ncbi:MAG: LacI family transcriptional regulator [Lachnospiraceae bacterium]|nr:LacI family transcriptional regulator [Lachnospiraceae bacterium]
MVGIKDIAKKAGVSFSTVSIILNGRAEERKISPGTQKKVMDAVKELQYRPNISAKSLKEGRNSSFVIALFWSFDFRKAMASRFLSGLQDKKKNLKDNIDIIVYPYQSGQLYKEKSLLQGNKYHAAIIANASQEDLEYLESINTLVPIVLYNRFSDKYSSVNLDDRRIGEAAAEHLMEQGYKKPFLITSAVNFPGASLRRKAFCERLKKSGIQITEQNIMFGDDSVGGGAECGRMLVESGRIGQSIDSIFCASDALGIGLCYELNQARIRMPEELGVLAIGNGEPQYSQFCTPSISVINIPMEQMSATCYELLEKKIKQGHDKVERVLFETIVLPRESTKKHKI